MIFDYEVPQKYIDLNYSKELVNCDSCKKDILASKGYFRCKEGCDEHLCTECKNKPPLDEKALLLLEEKNKQIQKYTFLEM